MSAMPEWQYMCIETQILGPRGCIECVVFEDDDCIQVGSGPEAERRAHLMAAAPDLYNALVECVELYEEAAAYKGEYLTRKHSDAEEIARFRALLQKARGKED